MYMLHVQYEDVICRLFPYSLQDEAYYWFARFLAASINPWQALKDAFLNRFRKPTSPVDLYRYFVEIWRVEGELINTFNNRFHKSYCHLQAPYNIVAVATLPIYYDALDKLTSMFVRRANPPVTTLAEAYTEVVKVNTELGQSGLGPIIISAL